MYKINLFAVLFVWKQFFCESVLCMWSVCMYNTGMKWASIFINNRVLAISSIRKIKLKVFPFMLCLCMWRICFLDGFCLYKDEVVENAGLMIKRQRNSLERVLYIFFACVYVDAEYCSNYICDRGLQLNRHAVGEKPHWKHMCWRWTSSYIYI